MEEIWKDVKGFEGKYKISNLGRVMSLNYKNTGKTGFIKPVKNKDGYLIVKIFSDKRYTKSIHRLVGEAFIEKPKLEINHLNGNKEDNSIDNLEWCTHAENERYSWKTLGKKRNGENKREYRKAIIQYDLNNNYIKKWTCMSEAARTLGIRISKISDCCRGTRNKTGGYKWRFENDNK